MDTLILLQTFAESPEAARTYLLEITGPDDALKKSFDRVLTGPHRIESLGGSYGPTVATVDEAIQLAWEWCEM
jgi:hypothetical protein